MTAGTDPELTGRPGEGVVPGAVAMSSMVEPDPASFTRFQRFAMRSIGWYQRTFSFRPSPCRFSPSCSVYSAEAIAVHGSRRGLWLAVKRLGRCRPFGPSGWDPVPTPSDSASRPRTKAR